AGFQVTVAASAPEALQACAAWRPDAVVAAAELDGMTGVDLAYAMSEHPLLSDVPLVLSGDEGDLSRLEAFRAGVRDYIPRPFLDEELVIRILRVAAPVSTANAGLRGSLVDISLGTLLSLLEYERKSGILMLARTNELARIFVSEGRLLKVESSLGNGAGGRERIMGLLDWREGQFEFSPSSIGGRDELGLAVTALLLEHARTRDEQAAPLRQRR
ncbi:MAG TPA: response regulator, partial [Kofleriaceae bacterium]|nr:response regulator [Kofleriaceae bacterium]